MKGAVTKIEITRDEKGNCSTQMQGEAIGLLAGLLGGVNQIYKTLPEVARGAFRSAVIHSVTEFDSPVWDTTENGEGTRMIVPVPRKERDGK